MLDRNRAVVALLAAGSSTPDAIEVRLDRPDTINAAIEKLDRLPALVRPALGLLAIDVAEVTGAVVVAVDANGPAAAARVQPGDVVVTAGGQPVPDASALSKIVAAHTPGSPLALEIRDAKGATRKADVDAFLAPRLIGLSDQTLLPNRVLVDLRARLATATDPFEQSVIRLNTAVALARTGDWSGARELLKQVELPDRPGVGAGTVQYLLGVVLVELGSRAEAEAAFKAAAASESLLTEDGPPVRELAEVRLAGRTGNQN
jgi:membrane-associated protease RseP (regulator of RpoE activity)